MGFIILIDGVYKCPPVFGMRWVWPWVWCCDVHEDRLRTRARYRTVRAGVDSAVVIA